MNSEVVRKSFWMPVEFLPSAKAFEDAGFIIQDVGESMRYVSLPVGWQCKKLEMFWYQIVDDQGRVRGECFRKWDGAHQTGYSKLNQITVPV